MTKLKHSIKTNADLVGLFIALIVLFIIFTILNPLFITKTNITNILVAASIIGLVSVGETFLIISGNVDLSPGSTVAFSTVLAALLLSLNVPPIITIIIVILVGGIIGLFNAFIINTMKIEPFIATLATMSIMRGLAFILCQGKPIFIKNKSFLMLSQTIFGVPISIIVLMIVFIIFGFILAKTQFGRNTYAIGGSPNAAKLAGININKHVIKMYVIMGCLAAISGLLLAARMRSGQPASSDGLEFDAITAAVLGGVAFSGGRGKLIGTFLGLIILQAFNTGLVMNNVDTFWQQVAQGGLLLVALSFDYIRSLKFKLNKEK